LIQQIYVVLREAIVEKLDVRFEKWHGLVRRFCFLNPALKQQSQIRLAGL